MARPSPGSGPADNQERRLVALRDGLELAIRRGGRRGVGELIRSEQDPALLAGVRIAALPVWADDRGYFLEVARLGQELARDFGGAAERAVQVSATLSYPGTIKALHYHCRQTDLWAVVAGMAQVCLYDLRVGSPAFARTNTLYIGHLRPWGLLIPPGVAHGYKVLGTDPTLLVYVTNRFYDPADEGRLPYDDPDINYDWELQHR